MEVIVNGDTKVLIPNNDHKNFTETDEIISDGILLRGNYKEVKGLRRGEPFTYRLFVTNNGKIIYKNKTIPMRTEVKLGADSTPTTTKVNLLPAEKSHAHKYYGVVLGGIAGFAYAKYKKHDTKHIAKWIAIGAALGYVAAYIYDRNKNKVVVTPSK